MTHKLTFGSLFAGIGGLDLGLERAGMKCAWQVEIDDYARRVLEKHWPDVYRWDDVRTFEPPGGSIDVIAGGFPCQDISHAGKGAGIDGERSGLWSEFARIIRQVRPRYVVVENVAALYRRGLGRILGDLADCGFDAEWESLPAKSFGAPHERRRTFVVGYANDPRCESNNGGIIFRQKPSWGNWWTTEPDVCRVVDGVSGTVGTGGGNLETAALANAVVPQVAEYIGCAIMRHHQQTLIDQAASAAQHQHQYRTMEAR